MDKNFNDFNEFLNYCMKFYENDNVSGNDTDSNGNDSNNSESNCGGDIPGGFQTINPQFFLLIGELMGNVMAGNMPFNVQNVIGNWLQLIGQAIETYNAQQQYMQAGPGRYYDLGNLNINNPFCSDNNNNVQQEADGVALNNSNNANSNNESMNEEINELKEYIKKLNNEVKELKAEIRKIKKDK